MPSQADGAAPSRGSKATNLPNIFDPPDYEVFFKHGLDKRFECPVCCQILRYPVQFECGHRCCSACLPELLRVAPRCPIDQIKVERERVYVDKAYQKEIDALEVKCSYYKKGCSWLSTFKELAGHVEKCEHASTTCPNRCGAEFEKRFLEQHVRRDCARRGITCDFCMTKILFEDEVDHLTICDKFLVPCPNGCKKKEIPRGEVQKHVEKDCPKQTVPCPFSEAGCQHRGERKHIDKHIKEEPEKHLNLVSTVLANYKRTLELQTEAIEQQADRLDVVEFKVDSLEKLYGAQLVWKIDNYTEKMEEAISGKKTTIYSPPFLTSRHGYKMALSACLNGDGRAKGKHMSLFCCICRGDYDALLLWPFCHRVTFTLIDQCQDTDTRKNITYTVKPNIVNENKAFLGRPTAERNASFGATKFVEIETLNTLDYVKDDCLFVKVVVDSEDMICL